MKKLIILLALVLPISILDAQETDSSILAKINGGQTVTATTKSASRLFGDKDDLTSVLFIVPVGSTVQILGIDSTYYRVISEGSEGYIFKRHAIIDEKPATIGAPPANIATNVEETVVETKTEVQTSRLSELQARYDQKTAKSIFERKIWKGMNTDMVIDSWGNPQKINRTIIPDSVKEEWSYTSTWLYFENDILVSWGPIEK